MIFVRRSDTPAVLVLTNAESDGAKEYRAALKWVQEGAAKPPGSIFKIYSHITVKEALRHQFRNKCAYCESLIAGAQDTDVEHFRPKGEVTEAKAAKIDHPGYWWLAMDWTNLTLSCMHCNQGRRHVVVQPGMTINEVRDHIENNQTEHAGKANAFPTADGNWVTQYDGDIATEKPLLIDPTKVDPADHLEWNIDGPLSTVVPKNSSPIGEASIRVYGLNRRLLTEDRMVFLNELIFVGNKVLAALNNAKEATDLHIAHAHHQTALDFLDVLEEKCRPEKPYAALAAAYRRQLAQRIERML